MLNEFRVQAGNEWHSFLTFEAAKSFAEKTSWDHNIQVLIYAPDGNVTKVKVG